MKRINLKTGILFFCVMTLGVLFAHTSVQAQQTESTVSYLETFGYAEGEYEPDKITISILLNEAEIKRKSLDDLQKKMVDALIKLGIDVEKNLKVISMQASLKQYVLAKDDVLQRREFELIVSDYAMANKVFEVMDWIGVSAARIVRWELQDFDKALGELKLQAIKAGKTQAQAMASAAGNTLGETLLIQDERRYDRNQFVRYAKENMLKSRDMSMVISESGIQKDPEINFGPIKLNVTVQMRFKLTEAKP